MRLWTGRGPGTLHEMARVLHCSSPESEDRVKRTNRTKGPTMAPEERRKLVEAPLPQVRRYGGCTWTGATTINANTDRGRYAHVPWLWDEAVLYRTERRGRDE